MENNKTAQLKKDRKITTKFIIIMALSFIGGGLLGFLMTAAYKIIPELFGSTQAFIDKLMNILGYSSIFMIIILCITVFILSYTILSKCKKLVSTLDTDDELGYSKIDKSIGFVLNMNSISNILNMFFFGIAFYNTASGSFITKFMFMAPITICFFMATLFINVVFQRMAVNIYKQLNPEKDGNVLDTHFREVWISTCDEAELQLTYEAAYKSYIFMNGMFMICLTGLTVIGMFFKIGLLPLVLVSVLFLAQQLSYAINAAKLEKPCSI